jgi:glycosyltransferase involved in cell wall biosynthesis
VHVFPVTVSGPEPGGSVPASVPAGRFVFLFTFDFLSVFERKNPLAIVEAFSKAFTPSEGPVLVVKSVNGDLRRLGRDRVRLAAADRPDIVLIEDYLTNDERDALLARADAYVSLHRAEGFGLTMAEAMILGKPVIATGYSGNLDFMTEENSFLVPYEMAEVPPGCEPYLPGTPWAEPDVDVAARLMRQVVDEPDLAAAKAAVAQADIARTHGLDVAAAFVERRFEALAAARRHKLELLSHQQPDGSSDKPRRSPTARQLTVAALKKLARSLERSGSSR